MHNTISVLDKQKKKRKKKLIGHFSEKEMLIVENNEYLQFLHRAINLIVLLTSGSIFTALVELDNDRLWNLY